MATLTNFAWAIHRGDGSEDETTGPQRFRSYPQDIANNLELRTFSSLESTHRVTDYFELYWSHLKSRENVNFVFRKWLSGVMQLDEALIPPNLATAFKVLKWLRRTILGTVGILALALAALAGMEPGMARGAVAFVTILTVLLIVYVYGYRLPEITNVIGDVARYLSPEPENIASRQAIRQAGIDLLNRLHEVREGDGQFRYDRIIVVGHSLGSIIAYDVLLNCFAQRNGYPKIEDWLRLAPDGRTLPTEDTNFITIADDTHLKALRTAAQDLYDEQDNLSVDRIADAFCPKLLQEECYRPGSYPQDSELEGSKIAYWQAQRATFEAARHAYFKADRISRARKSAEDEQLGARHLNGPPGTRQLDWRVSDFITLGSPLTYASILLVQGHAPGTSKSERETRQEMTLREKFYAERTKRLQDAKRCDRNWPLNGELDYSMSIGLLPTAPPRGVYPHVNLGAIFYFVCGQRAVLANNSPFALTRWTNLYFPSNGLLCYGDIVSGPLGPVFGLGIKDIPLDPRDIKLSRRLRPRFAHTYYWNDDHSDWDFVETLKGAPPKTRRPLRIKALLDALDLTREGDDWPKVSPAVEPTSGANEGGV